MSLAHGCARGIKASPRISRAEALHYAHEHPDEVLVALEDKTEQLVRALEERERAAAKATRGRPTAAEYREAFDAEGCRSELLLGQIERVRQ
jgi:hypothetical protein